MKTLLILRHAKSSWANPALSDFERPLKKRGKRDAPRMGRLIRQQDLVPDFILSSPAKRARNTAKAAAEECGYEGEIEYVPEFYPGDPMTHIETLADVPDWCQIVMVVGHNPGLEELIYVLAGESARMPTAALAELSLPIDHWVELDDEPAGSLTNLWWVKELG